MYRHTHNFLGIQGLFKFLFKLFAYFFYHLKIENINASFIGIKFKNKIYRHKRSINIFSDKNLNRLKK